MSETSDSPYVVGETTALNDPARNYPCVSTIVLHGSARRLFAINRRSVSAFDIHPSTGGLIESSDSPVDTEADFGASLQLNDAANRLYATSGWSSENTGFFAVYDVTPNASVTMLALGTLMTSGSAIHSALADDGSFLLTYYGTGGIQAHEVLEDGAIAEIAFYQDTIVAPELRARPNSGQVLSTHRGDGLGAYFRTGDGGLSHSDLTESGVSLAFSPDGDVAYSGARDEPRIHAFTFDDVGTPSPVEGAPFDVSDGVSASTCMEVSGDGQYLVVADVPEDALALFEIDDDSHRPRHRSSVDLRGSSTTRTPTWIVTTF